MRRIPINDTCRKYSDPDSQRQTMRRQSMPITCLYPLSLSMPNLKFDPSSHFYWLHLYQSTGWSCWSTVNVSKSCCNIRCIPIWLVVLTILKNMKVNGKDYPIYYGKKCSKPPTSHITMAKLHDSIELLWPLLFSAAPLEAMLQNEAQHGHKTLDANFRCGLRNNGTIPWLRLDMARWFPLKKQKLLIIYPHLSPGLVWARF